MWQQCLKLSKDISAYIKNHVRNNSGFGARTFYGEAFTLALLANTGELDAEVEKTLLDSLNALDHEDPAFHWEFNYYALSEYNKISKVKSFDKMFKCGRFTGTKCTNWSLLRYLHLMKVSENPEAFIKKSIRLIESTQLGNGLILDQPDVKSFQYHCFSLSIIIEIYEFTNEEYFLSAFMKGVEFIRRFIIQNGMALYIGRGQEQIFGYGTLVYLLAQAFKITKDKAFYVDLSKVVTYLQKHVRKDGSFPLVLNKDEKGTPGAFGANETKFPGWYAYNNYFDYLPFLGLYLYKAYEILKDISQPSLVSTKNSSCYTDDDFLVIRKKVYDAVVSRPGGSWANGLAMPFVVSRNTVVMPCYGGEQYEESLYSIRDQPLPYFLNVQKSIVQKSISKLSQNRLMIVSPLGIMYRTYQFLENSIKINTRVFSPFRVENPILFYEDIEQMTSTCFKGAQFEINVDEPMRFLRNAHCALGKLNVYGTFKKNYNLTIHFISC